VEKNGISSTEGGKILY